MIPNAYDLKAFYNTLQGRILRRVLRDHIMSFWPDVKDLSVMGSGYALPYMKPFMDEAQCVFSVFPAGQGAHHWPQDFGSGGVNQTCLAGQTELPFETNSIDRILMIHALEFSEQPGPTFEELFRVLKSNGRLLIVVPNRMGLWARADWSPFGQGTPYSAAQVISFLRDNQFVHERTRHALFVPPFRRTFLLRAAGLFEKIGRAVCSGIGGVYIVEASKQIYAGKGSGLKARNPIRAKIAGVRKPASARDIAPL